MGTHQAQRTLKLLKARKKKVQRAKDHAVFIQCILRVEFEIVFVGLSAPEVGRLRDRRWFSVRGSQWRMRYKGRPAAKPRARTPAMDSVR
jgi:hypothetical protein